MATKDPETQEHGHAKNGEAPALVGGGDLGRQVSVTLTPSQFEEMYFQPGVKSRLQQENVKRFGNPTSIGIVGFLLTFAPTMAVLCNWRGTTSASLLALLGVFYMMGGILLWVAGLLEWVVGNTYPSVVFASFGSFWLSLGVTLDPNFGVVTALGATGPAFNNAFGFYLIYWAVYVYFLSIGALKTNVTLFVIVFTVALVFNLLGVGYFRVASASANANDVFIAAGAVGFITVVAGYYILLHLILAAVEFPVNVPLGDLSRFYKKRETTD